MSKQKNVIRPCLSDRIFHIVNCLIMGILLVVFIWPLWFVVIASFSDPAEVLQGRVLLYPIGFTLDSYREALKNTSLWMGYRNTIFYTVVGTTLNIAMTICAAFPLSRKDFVPRKFLTFFFMLTMYFSGGMIPLYMVVQKLRLLNTPWAMIIPSAVSIFNVLIARTYFINSIPDSLEEAAKLDGASTLQYLLKIVLPLSKPILAVLVLYYAVARWNDFFSAIIYISKRSLLPLQYILRELLIINSNIIDGNISPEELTHRVKLAQTMKYSIIIFASAPMLCIYPFIQKYFVKGVMIGSVKG